MANDNTAAHVEAVLDGRRTFDPVEPCRHGHLSPRSTADGRCVECRRATWRRWRDRNPAKALAHLERMLADKGIMEG